MATLNVPATYATIQAAINASSSGDTVLVAAGTYTERLNFTGKSVNVKSVSGAAATIIDVTGLADASYTVDVPSGTTVITSGSAVFVWYSLDGSGLPVSHQRTLAGFTVTGGTGRVSGIDRQGGGLYLSQTRITVQNCIFNANTASAGGGMHLSFPATDTIVRDCVFTANVATLSGENGGAGMFVTTGLARIDRCTFRQNTATGAAKGGGIHLVRVGYAPPISNCLFDRNSARHGGAIMVTDSKPIVVNCTMSGNTAVNFGGAIRANHPDSELRLRNSILWQNTAGQPNSDELYDDPGVVSTVDYSLVRGGWSGAGANNLQLKPGFTDLGGFDYTLKADSNCVDSGNNAFIPLGSFSDVAGQPRIATSDPTGVGLVVDRGCYERQPDAGTAKPNIGVRRVSGGIATVIPIQRVN